MASKHRYPFSANVILVPSVNSQACSDEMPSAVDEVRAEDGLTASAVPSESTAPGSIANSENGAGSNGASTEYAPPIGPAEIVPHPLVDSLIPDHKRQGVLIPLKTTLELRQDHAIIQAYITRAPVKATNEIIK